MVNIDSKIDFCNKEQEALSVLGKPKIIQIYNDLKKNNNMCACCGFKPNVLQNLKLHIIDYFENNANACLLCEACFLIKHFDKALEQKCVALANSEYTQISLMEIQRKSNKTTNQEILKKRIVVLKETAEDYATKIKSDNLLYSPYIKVLFNNNFKWNNCK